MQQIQGIDPRFMGFRRAALKAAVMSPQKKELAIMQFRSLLQRSQLEEFANLLEDLCAGNPAEPMPMPLLTEQPISVEELSETIRRVKQGKASDDFGLVAELLHHAQPTFLNALLEVLNHLLRTGDVPDRWRKTCFQMLPKARTKNPAHFRPIASFCLLCRHFFYVLLSRIEATLDAHQPEEQHGFRKGRRVEEHLLTANLIIDKSFACNLPMWIINLDLSKAFDRVDWDALWDALRHHGVSEHIIWILQRYMTRKA